MSASAAAAQPHANGPNDLYVLLDADDRISYVSAGLQDELGRWVGHVIWDHLPGRIPCTGRCSRKRARRAVPPNRCLLRGQGEAAHRDPCRGRACRPRGAPGDPRRQDSRDTGRESRARCATARCSSARATRFTSSRVSASSSLSAESSTACAVAASGARTRSLTVVSVSSAIRLRRGNEGVVTPRSQRDTVIDSTPSCSASSFWVRPALRLAVRSRPPTPPPSWVPKLQG